jgi:hypothetical protein
MNYRAIIFASMGAFYVPFSFITACYVVIFVKLRGKMKKRREKVEEQQQNFEMKRRNLTGKRFSRVSERTFICKLLLGSSVFSVLL